MTAIAERAAPRTAARRTPRPSFAGSVGAEVLKLSRQAMVWAMLGLALLLFAVVTGAMLQADNLRTQLHEHPDSFMFLLSEVYLAMFDAGAGIVLLLVSARLVGMEYSAGTIRVLLSRGAGRLRLLLAKVTALLVLALVLLAGFVVLAGAVVCAAVVAWDGGLAPLTRMSGAVWTDLGIAGLVAVASMGVCILLGTAAAVVGRSVAFGTGAALALFPIDNFGTQLLTVLHALTGWHAWLDVSTFLLGPNLNVLATLMITDHHADAAFSPPLLPIDVTHAWLVVAAWSALLAAVAVIPTLRRDVLQ